MKIILHTLLFPAVAAGLLAGFLTLATARECRSNHFVIVGTAAVEGVPATVRIMNQGVVAWRGALSVKPVEVGYVLRGDGHFRVELDSQAGAGHVSEFGYISGFEGVEKFIVVDRDRVHSFSRDNGLTRIAMDYLSCLTD